jgi:uncharacterized protein YndB with AHSA1/START domain
MPMSATQIADGVDMPVAGTRSVDDSPTTRRPTAATGSLLGASSASSSPGGSHAYSRSRQGAKMAAIVKSIEISRSPEDVFSYAVDPLRFPEWQGGVASAYRDETAPLTVGSKTIVVRQVGPRRSPTTEEITEMAPPGTWEVRANSGRLVATAKGMIEPLDGGTRSRVTIALDFTGHGIGKLLVPLVVRRQVKRTLPRNEQKLKEILERWQPWA